MSHHFQDGDAEKLKQLDDHVSTLHAYIEEIGQAVLADAAQGK